MPRRWGGGEKVGLFFHGRETNEKGFSRCLGGGIRRAIPDKRGGEAGKKRNEAMGKGRGGQEK